MRSRSHRYRGCAARTTACHDVYRYAPLHAVKPGQITHSQRLAEPVASSHSLSLNSSLSRPARDPGTPAPTHSGVYRHKIVPSVRSTTSKNQRNAAQDVCMLCNSACKAEALTAHATSPHPWLDGRLLHPCRAVRAPPAVSGHLGGGCAATEWPPLRSAAAPPCRLFQVGRTVGHACAYACAWDQPSPAAVCAAGLW